MHSESVNDLFDDTPGTSNVLIVAIETFFTPPDEELSFGEILHIVTMCSDGRDKCIGFTTVDGEQVLGPFKACCQGHRRIVQRLPVKRVQQRQLGLGQCRRGMPVIPAEPRREHRCVQIIGKAQCRNHQRARCYLMPLCLQMPDKPRRGPVKCPEQRADGLPVARPGIASLLQATPQQRSRRNALWRFGQDLDHGSDAGCRGPARRRSRGSDTRPVIRFFAGDCHIMNM